MLARGALCIILLGAALAHAQSPSPRLCFLTQDPGTLQSNRYGSFFQGLRELGYVDGKSIRISYLSAEGRGERFPALASECVRLRADVIVAATTPAAQAAKKATSTVPIVIGPLGDPVGSALVASLAQPGANVTGLSFMAPGLAAKRVELLKQAMPQISRVLLLTFLADPIARPQVEEMKKAASSMGIALTIRDVRNPDDFEAAFSAASQARVEGMLITAESIFIANQERLIALARKYRLPGVYSRQSFALAGGLMSYSANLDEMWARAATYVDNVLKGGKPANMPVEQATKFELVVNLKTAKALGVTIPQSILLRADKVIE